MSLSCYSDYSGDDFAWYWDLNVHQDLKPLATKNSRKCCSCKNNLAPGYLAASIRRFRPANSRIEERIYGDEVPLSPWHMCETCFDLAVSLDELGFCFELGGGSGSLKQQIAEYRRDMK